MPALDDLPHFDPGRSLVGVDISSQDDETAACVVGLRDGKLSVAARARMSDDKIEGLVDDATVVAIDAPFGWPSAFTGFAGRWRANPGVPELPDWLHRDQTPETLWWELAEALKFRATDRYVRLYRRTQHSSDSCPARWPPGFSVAADKIALPAMRTMRLLHSAGVKDLTGRGEVAVEVYPGAALAEWHRNPDAYKDSGAVAARRDIVTWLLGCLKGNGRWDLDPQAADKLQGQAIASGHVLDAFVCALTGWAALVEGGTARPDESTLNDFWEAELRVSKKPKKHVHECKLRELVGQGDLEPVDVVAAEGWIHHPNRNPEDFLKDDPWQREERGLPLW